MAQVGLHEYIPKQHRAEVKRILKEEWNHQCAYCGIKERNKELTIDHIVPLTKNGDDSYSNLVPACRPCNLSKADFGIRQWYFDNPNYTAERWLRIKQHMTQQIRDAA